MLSFNKLFKQIMETTSTSVLGGEPGKVYGGDTDTRAFEPARMVIGAKFKKGKNKTTAVKVPIHQRKLPETVFLKGKK